MSLLAGPREKAPGRIPGRWQSPGSSGHFKVFNAGKSADLKINSGSFYVTQVRQISKLPFRKIPLKIADW